MGYVFYDTETSGLNPRHDEILQFAAITTDVDFLETGRFERQLRLSPHIIPSPSALRVNRISVAECYSPRRSSQLQGIYDIHNFVGSRSPATYVGWNLIGFDEEFLRHSFYRQLLDAYPTSRNNNARMDLLGVVRATDAIRPGTLNIPHGPDGKKTFRLQDLCRANGIHPRAAHEAMSDVEATIAIAKLVKYRQPEIWSAFAQTSRKRSAMDILDAKNPCVVVTGWKDRTRMFVGIEIGRDPKLPYSYILDLAVGLPDFDPSDFDACVAWFNNTPKPVIKIRCNASPTIVPIDDLEEYDDKVDDLCDRASVILSDTAKVNRFSDAFHAHISRDYDPEHVEDMLYSGGFPTDRIFKQLHRFRQVDWEDAVLIARSLDDRRYRKFAMRLIAEHAPELLTDEERRLYDEFLLARFEPLLPNDVPWMSLTRARQEIEMLDITAQKTLDREYAKQFLIYRR
ncbi:MAG: exonuclease domain-containing protein [Litorimonas sp.]